MSFDSTSTGSRYGKQVLTVLAQNFVIRSCYALCLCRGFRTYALQSSITLAGMLHVSVLTVAISACIAHLVVTTMLLGTQNLKDDGFFVIQVKYYCTCVFSSIRD